MRPDIYNIKSIGKGSLSVMAKPVSGEWIKDEFKVIANRGINLIVSLLEEQESKEVGLADEQALNGSSTSITLRKELEQPKLITD
jgi:hypothetical protein